MGNTKKKIVTFSQAGHLGGKATRKKHGKKHFEMMGKKSGEARRKKA